MQRLFSTFPSGWPGVGLLLLRLCLGLRVMYVGILGLSVNPAGATALAPSLVAVLASIFLLAGLWTPIIGAILALAEVGIALSLRLSHRGEDILIPVFLAVLSVCVAMLGPGAFSVDARLFGRKRFDIDRTRR